MEDGLRAMAAQGHAPEPETLQRVFRSAHTVKGTAAFFGLAAITSVAHAAENVLGALRERRLDATPPVAGVLAEAVLPPSFSVSVTARVRLAPAHVGFWLVLL